MYEYEVKKRADTEKEFAEVSRMVSQNEELEKKLNEMMVIKAIEYSDYIRRLKWKKRK